jgi:hypothetical protein
MYCTMRVVAIMMDDVIPLYFSSPVEAGGLAFGTQDIGLTLILNGASLITFQLFVFYRLERRWGCVRCYTYGNPPSPSWPVLKLRLHLIFS